MSKTLSDDEILKLIGEEEQKRILSEISDIDEKISLFDIEVPSSLDKKTEDLEIASKTFKKEKNLYKKIAVVAFILFFIGQQMYIYNPDIAFALKVKMLQVVSFQTKQALDINLYQGDNLLDKLQFCIPKGFKKSNYVDDFNKQKVVYFNENDEFIKISIYPDSFSLALDNENAQEYENIKVNDYSGKIIIKNDVITILFLDGVSLFEVESNLSKKEVLRVAETIYVTYHK